MFLPEKLQACIIFNHKKHKSVWLPAGLCPDAQSPAGGSSSAPQAL